MADLAQARVRFGGSFAPPLTDKMLADYGAMIADVDPQTEMGEALRTCMKCVKAWWDVPVSSGGTFNHPGNPFMIGGQPVHVLVHEMDEGTKTALWDSTPWMAELAHYGKLFDELHPGSQRDLRNCAFHLLWHCKEICSDREPLTMDKL